MAKTLQPGIPSSQDMSMPTAEEVAEAEVRRREAHERQERIADARRLVAEEEARLAYRDTGVGEARGGDRGAWSNDEWDRASEHSDPERRRRIQEAMDDTVLPKLPHRDGFHRVWVSTTHNNDTPQRRMRMGYWFFKHEQAQKENWHSDDYAVTDATSIYKGFLMWREMIAMEIDEEGFRIIMRENHHDRPMDQERGIYDQLEAAGAQIRDGGGRTTMSPGMETLRQFRRPPKQFMT
jgi:hypothetical protein